MWRKNPVPKLVHSVLPDDQLRRITRLMLDVHALRGSLTRGQIMTAYEMLEAARDALSRMLDQADDKDA